MTSAIFETTIVCDMIIQDVSGKHTLIGVYHGDILPSKLPAALRLALFTILNPTSGGDHRVDIFLTLGDKPIANGVIELKDAAAGAPVAIALPSFNLRIEEPSSLKVEASVDAGPRETLLSKMIIQNPQALENGAATAEARPPNQVA